MMPIGLGVSLSSVCLSPLAGLADPVVTAFVLPYCSDETVVVTTFTATATAPLTVAKYLINESPITPSGGDPGWSDVVPTPVTTASSGSVTFYAWVKDSYGHISASASATVKVVPGLVSWLEPARNVTVVEAAGPNPDLTTGWTAANVTPTTGQPDHIGGTSAVKLLETVANGLHRKYAVDATVTAGPLIQRVYAAPVARDVWQGVQGDVQKAWFDLAGVVAHDIDAGAVSSIHTTTPGGVALQNGFYRCDNYHVNAPTGQINIAVYAAATSYAGDITKGAVFAVPAPGMVQHRASQINDQFGAHNFIQGTIGAQQFVQKADGSSPGGNSFAGVAATWQPNNVLQTMTNADAALCAVMADGAAWSVVAKVRKIANPSAVAPFVNATGTGVHTCGIDTAGKPYLAQTDSGTITSSVALDTDMHRVAWTMGAGAAPTGATYVDATKTTGACTPGTITPTLITFGLRGSACSALVVSSSQLSDAQIAAVQACL